MGGHCIQGLGVQNFKARKASMYLNFYVSGVDRLAWVFCTAS
jgi:hypothetical protein